MKVMYLFKRNNIDYGVDLLLYKISPFLVEIKQINTLQIINVLSADDIIRILEFLVLSNTQPAKLINQTYTEITLNQEEFQIA